MRRLSQDMRGSTVVEFALVSPVVIMLILAALQLGTVLRANSGLRDLAGWAGREAVVMNQSLTGQAMTPAQVRTAILNRFRNPRYNLASGALTVAVNESQDTTLLTVKRMRIQMTYNNPVSVPFLPVMNVPMSVDRTFFIPN